MAFPEKTKKEIEEINRKKAEEANSIAISPITGQRIGIVAPTGEAPKGYSYIKELGKSIAEGYSMLNKPTDYANRYWAGRVGENVTPVVPTTTPVIAQPDTSIAGRIQDWNKWTPSVEGVGRINAGVNADLTTKPPLNEQIGLDLAGRPTSNEPIPTSPNETWTPAMKAMYARSPQRTVQYLADTGHVFTNADLLAMGGKESDLTEEQNLAIIAKNRADYSRALDESIAGRNERDMRDAILRAINQPTPQNIAAAKIAETALSGMPAFAKERREGYVSPSDYGTALAGELQLKKAGLRPVEDEIAIMKAQHPTEKTQIDKLTSGFTKKTYNEYGMQTGEELNTGAFYDYVKANPQLGIMPPESWNPGSNMENITGYSRADILAEKKRRGLIK